MALDDIAIDVGINVDDAGLDALIGKLEALDAIDPVEIDVELDVDDNDIENVVENIATPDGGADTDADGGSGSRIDPLGFAAVDDIERELEKQFDPRGLINEDLTIEDITEDTDTDIFDIRENQADDLIDTGRSDRGIENLFDFDRSDFSPADLFGMQENDPDTFAEEMEKVIQTPRDRALDRRGGNPLTVALDRILGRDRVTGENIGGRGVLGRFDDLSMEQFYTALAQVVPLLLTFAASLPAAITGIVGLGAAAVTAAGALAAVGGLALMGGALALGGGDIQQGLTEIQEIIREDILGAIQPLARQFDDLFMDALNGFEEFMQSIAQHGQTLTRLKDDARALGQFIMDFVPPALSSLTAMADAFMPLFAMFGEGISSSFNDFLRSLVGATRRALPYILSLANSFMQMLPLIFDLSMGALMVTAAFFRVLGVIASIIDWMGPLGTVLGFVTGGVLSLVSAGALLYQIGLLLGPVYTFLAGSALVEYAIATGIAMVETYGLAASLLVAATAAGILLGVLTFGIAPILGSLSSGFLGISSDVDDATKSLMNFENTKNGLSGMGGMGSMGSQGGLPRGAMNVYEDNSTTNVEMPSDASTEDAHRLGRRINYGNSQMSPF